MKFGIQKCDMLAMKKCRVIELPDGKVTKLLPEAESCKYLKILEGEKFLMKERENFCNLSLSIKGVFSLIKETFEVKDE